jgi:hypothetical protein
MNQLLTGFHKHHIIPRYKGGTDAPENLVTLHPMDHAIAHKVRQMRMDGFQYKEISKETGFFISVISGILNGKQYVDVGRIS